MQEVVDEARVHVYSNYKVIVIVQFPSFWSFEA